jgi:transglutaminase-like putative cysteine protease
VIKALQSRLSRSQSILLLSLTALACLPFVLRKPVPDAALSLLLPITLASAALAWGVAGLNFKSSWTRLLFLAAGPLFIYAWIAQIFPALADAIRETQRLVPQSILWVQNRTPIDTTACLLALQELGARMFTLGQRVFVWLAGALRGNAVQDPAARAFVWSLGMWWLAAWAGRQMRVSILDRKPGQALLALLPCTALLGWVLDSTAQKSFYLWLHLAALLMVLALANYESLAHFWRQKRMDFSDSTWEDTLIATSALTAGLLICAYLAYSISVEDIRERIREWNENRTRASNSEGAGSPDGTGPPSRSGVGQGLGDIHSVSAGPVLSDDIVMIVFTGERPSVPQNVNPNAPYYYWRTITYQTYIGSGWTNPVRPGLVLPPDQPLLQANPPDHRLVRQEVTFNTGAAGQLYWTGILVSADTPLEVAWRAQPNNDQLAAAGLDPLFQADMITALTDSGHYTAVSLVSQPGEDALRASRPVYPNWVTARYLGLPDRVPERVRALARDLTASASTPYDRAVAIETYLRQFPYNLEVPAPPAGRDVADYFLFDLKEGYCDYFATTMTVLARAAGLPARFVIGYANGTYDGLAAHYVVTQADSHAWVEIYFPGLGWVEFEPTPSQPAPVRAGTGATPIFTPAPARPFIWTDITDSVSRVLNFLWRPAAALLALFILWIGLQTLRASRLDPPDTIGAVYRRLRRLARAVSGSPPHSQTAYEYAAALTTQLDTLQSRNRLNGWLLTPVRAQVTALTELYAQSLFSPRLPGRPEARAATRTWFSLSWRLAVLNVVLGVNKILVRRT